MQDFNWYHAQDFYHTFYSRKWMISLWLLKHFWRKYIQWVIWKIFVIASLFLLIMTLSNALHKHVTINARLFKLKRVWGYLSMVFHNNNEMYSKARMDELWSVKIFISFIPSHTQGYARLPTLLCYFRPLYLVVMVMSMLAK